jgi:hypothetical protein
MDDQQIDKLWEAAWDTYYQSYYEEMKAEFLIGRWQYLRILL